jgi:hypothetical protein
MTEECSSGNVCGKRDGLVVLAAGGVENVVSNFSPFRVSDQVIHKNG